MRSIEDVTGQTVNHVWFGFGDHAALYLELGELVQRTRRDGTPANAEGRITVHAGYEWRIESAESVLGGAACSADERSILVEQLLGQKVISAALIGRIPELQLGFSNGVWLATFCSSEGQPEWSVTWNPDTQVGVENGAVVVTGGVA